MTHRIDHASPRESAAMASGRIADAVSSRAVAPLVVVASTALILTSLALTMLTIGGVAHVLPSAVRAAIVCVVAFTLPGLPIAALLKLPLNGIFASVAVAVSIAANVLLAQLNFGSGVRQPLAFHFALLIVAGVAVAQLVRRSRPGSPVSTLRTAVTVIASARPPAGGRRVTVPLLTVSVVAFAIAVRRIDTDAAGAFGLLQILGVDYFLALAVLGVVLAIEYRRPLIDSAMIATSNVVLIIFVTMPVAWADRTAPFSTAYVHAFITQSMVDLGTLPPPLDARISWAGFFSTAAQLMTVGGLGDSDVFIVDASLVFGVLLMFPIYAIGRAITRDPRAAWLGVTVYVLFNWYQQDYFAPQAMAMQLYATVLAVLLWQLRESNVPGLDGPLWRRMATAWRRIPGRVRGRDARWTVAMEIVLVLIVTAQVVSHQLTPVATIFALVLFAVLGVARSKVLWLAAILIFVAWFTYGAHDFWQGHLGDIITDIGGVDQNVSSSVTGRPVGDVAYGRMQYLRIAASVVLFAAAAIGWLRLPKGPHRPILAALAVAPFSIVLIQSYGGEVAIRCFLYASPLLAPLAAGVLLPLLHRGAGSGRRSWLAVSSLAVLFFTLMVWVVTDRGLNTSFEHTTREEVVVARQILDHVDATQLAFWGQGAMWGLSKQFELGPACLADSRTLADCVDIPSVTYVVDSDQDEKYLQYQFGVDPRVVRGAVDILLADRGFEKIYDGTDIRVLKRTGAPDLTLGVGR